MTLVVADALYWLRWCEPADLILTDPPHLDTFSDVEEHGDFVERWLPLALEALNDTGSLYHTCGANIDELENYLAVRTPDQILVWPHPPRAVDIADSRKLFTPGHHLNLLYRRPLAPELRRKDLTTVMDLDKPRPFYELIISALTERGDLVVDPFCGRGEIPKAAQAAGRRYAGCDTDAASIEYARGPEL